jgi:glycosyltransferase involved in cell wall biosynthesis
MACRRRNGPAGNRVIDIKMSGKQIMSDSDRHRPSSLSVVIPSVGRPESLARALLAAALCSDEIEEVVVVCRVGDVPTKAVAESFGCVVAEVDVSGLAWAMRKGAEAAGSDVVAFTDDDAEIRKGWASRLLSHYQDRGVGGVGGVDVLLSADQRVTASAISQAGMVTRLGRVIGGHHLAEGGPRVVDHLKGVNSSFLRREFLKLEFQGVMTGVGAQTRNEFIASLGIKNEGYRLIFDPAAKVDHFPADRAEKDQRGASPEKAYESAFNESLGFRLYWRRRAAINSVFQILFGYRNAPGLARLLRGARFRDCVAVLRGVRDAGRVLRG